MEKVVVVALCPMGETPKCQARGALRSWEDGGVWRGLAFSLPRMGDSASTHGPGSPRPSKGLRCPSLPGGSGAVLGRQVKGAGR